MWGFWPERVQISLLNSFITSNPGLAQKIGNRGIQQKMSKTDKIFWAEDIYLKMKNIRVQLSKQQKILKGDEKCAKEKSQKCFETGSNICFTLAFCFSWCDRCNSDFWLNRCWTSFEQRWKWKWQRIPQFYSTQEKKQQLSSLMMEEAPVAENDFFAMTSHGWQPINLFCYPGAKIFQKCLSQM